MDQNIILTPDEQILYDIVFNSKCDPKIKTRRIYDKFIRPYVQKESCASSASLKPKEHLRKLNEVNIDKINAAKEHRKRKLKMKNK